MGTIKLALKNIRWNGFRSLSIFLGVAGVAAFLLSTTLIIRGAETSLDSGLQRMGADILVVPVGAETKLETALLMGKPTEIWMPRSNLESVASVPGVEAVSPQVYLASLYGAACCAVWEMFIVVYDPATDFTVTPWLRDNLGRDLARGEVVGGHYIFVPPEFDQIILYGYGMDLVGNLSATGTGLDQTLFMTMETAIAMAESSVTTAVQPLVVDPELISTIMVRVEPSADIHRVALDILSNTRGMVPIESPNLFGAFRNQMNGLLWGFFIISLIIWILSMLLIGLIFSMAANERRREMAVLRAIGATRGFIFKTLLSEAALLAAAGSLVGIIVAAGGLFVLKDLIAGSLRMPFLFPPLGVFLGLVGAGVGLALVTVTLAASIPAFRLSRQELAIAMRQ
ncbi:ABC transporter permease [Dehalogenimonas alkenigignens]|uniref:MacB-like periplasmic core domain/FtsX-like permease family n=1 Tax=Dehalogenimonas alkenigignens TaxID=1217799 RepID=A0A0W0GHA3_9CHLR|nr:ABC transporter permease [Dehalogenimonas alkenigignens]KTB47931.1 MacB-like periplasmic core domain/FtsX-like permease family [Dehalogenimonas alkenigignens]PVV82493.1 ABC transporter permease [Dehalogenimonas alkenigignens]